MCHEIVDLFLAYSEISIPASIAARLAYPQQPCVRVLFVHALASTGCAFLDDCRAERSKMKDHFSFGLYFSHG